MHALVTLEGYITAFEITPASTDDREGLRDLVDNCSIITILADKGYVGEKLMQEMQEPEKQRASFVLIIRLSASEHASFC